MQKSLRLAINHFLTLNGFSKTRFKHNFTPYVFHAVFLLYPVAIQWTTDVTIARVWQSYSDCGCDAQAIPAPKSSPHPLSTVLTVFLTPKDSCFISRDFAAHSHTHTQGRYWRFPILLFILGWKGQEWDCRISWYFAALEFPQERPIVKMMKKKVFLWSNVQRLLLDSPGSDCHRWLETTTVTLLLSPLRWRHLFLLLAFPIWRLLTPIALSHSPETRPATVVQPKNKGNWAMEWPWMKTFYPSPRLRSFCTTFSFLGSRPSPLLSGISSWGKKNTPRKQKLGLRWSENREQRVIRACCEDEEM